MAGKALIEMVSIKTYIFELMASVFGKFGALLAGVALNKMSVAEIAVRNSMNFLERAATDRRVAARIAVGFSGICLSTGGFIVLFLSILLSINSPWHNVLYIFTFIVGALIFQFAREDFDRD